MRCDDMLILFGLDLFITQPWLCDGMLYVVCGLYFRVENCDLCMRHLTQRFLESSISYT